MLEILYENDQTQLELIWIDKCARHYFTLKP